MLFVSISSSHAQGSGVSYRFEEGIIYVTFELASDSANLEEQLESIGTSIAESDSLIKLAADRFTTTGWELIDSNKKSLEFKKTISKLASSSKVDVFFPKENFFGKEQPYNLFPFCRV
jgi:hypothetical protein